MKLEEKLRSKKLKHPSQCGSVDEVITIYDAIKIAKEYAEDCCKRQREICASELSKTILDDGLTLKDINLVGIKAINNVKSAPLATEEK